MGYTLEQLKAMEGAAPTEPVKKGYSLQELQAMDSGNQQQPEEEGSVSKYGKMGLHAIGRALNIIPATAKALTLGTASEISGKLKGKDETEYLRELGNALTGKDVPSAEYFRRMGMEGETFPVNFSRGEFGEHVPAPLQYKTEANTRDMLGKATDLTFDVASPEVGGWVLQKAGKSLYKVPFRKMDRLAQAEGKIAPSEILYKSGKTPFTKEGIYEDVGNVIKSKTAQRNALEAPLMENTSLRGSMKSALQPAISKIKELKTSGSSYDRELGAALENDLQKQLALGERPFTPAVKTTKQVNTGLLDEMGNPITRPKEVIVAKEIPEQLGPTYKDLIDIKRGAGNSVKWGGQSGSKTEDAFLKAIGGGSRNESYKLAEQFSPNLASKIHGTNEEISSLISVLPEAERKAIIEAGKHGITEVDAMLALHPEILIPKQAGKLLKMPGPWTYSGRALDKAGNLVRPSTYMGLIKKGE